MYFYVKLTFNSLLHNLLFKVEYAFRHPVVLFPNPEENENRVDEEAEHEQETRHLCSRDFELRLCNDMAVKNLEKTLRTSVFGDSPILNYQCSLWTAQEPVLGRVVNM